MTVLLILILIVGASIWTKKLTIPAALTGGVLGWVIYWGSGVTGLCMLGTFFVLGTAATAWKKGEKRGLPGKDAHQTTRRTGQVLANGGVAALAAGLILLFPAYQHIGVVAVAGSLSSAMADTLSSELGSVYGKRFFNILTFRPDQKGLDGVISLEGLAIGIAGSAVIAGVYAIGYGWSPAEACIVIAGTAGNLADSVLGAALERKGRIGNDGVNFLNTLIGAGVAAALIMA